MKKYFLLKCFNGGNECLAECFGVGMTLTQAIEILKVSCPVTLNSDGYAKSSYATSDITYTIGQSVFWS